MLYLVVSFVFASSVCLQISCDANNQNSINTDGVVGAQQEECGAIYLTKDGFGYLVDAINNFYAKNGINEKLELKHPNITKLKDAFEKIDKRLDGKNIDIGSCIRILRICSWNLSPHEVILSIFKKICNIFANTKTINESLVRCLCGAFEDLCTLEIKDLAKREYGIKTILNIIREKTKDKDRFCSDPEDNGMTGSCLCVAMIDISRHDFNGIKDKCNTITDIISILQSKGYNIGRGDLCRVLENLSHQNNSGIDGRDALMNRICDILIANTECYLAGIENLQNAITQLSDQNCAGNDCITTKMKSIIDKIASYNYTKIKDNYDNAKQVFKIIKGMHGFLDLLKCNHDSHNILFLIMRDCNNPDVIDKVLSRLQTDTLLDVLSLKQRDGSSNVLSEIMNSCKAEYIAKIVAKIDSDGKKSKMDAILGGNFNLENNKQK